MTPADMIKTGTCSAKCLLAASPIDRCKCPCQGRHHSILLTADVTALVEARRIGIHHLTDGEIVAGDYLQETS